MLGLTKEEIEILKEHDTPKKIQDFINKIPINFEEEGEDTCISPRRILRENKCHCIEGAILAALMLRLQGRNALIVDLTSNDKDFDHVVAVFKEEGMWGAISKTNHAVLRYREPIYKSIRELAMTYFHEYFLDDGEKTLRSYTKPINLKIFDNKKNWAISEEDLWFIPEHIIKTKHYPMLTKKQITNLRKADDVEIEAGKITEWKKGEKTKMLSVLENNNL